MTASAPASVDEAQVGSGGPVDGPRHVAIIMDGNGRWAKARHLPRIAGHRKGVEAARKTVRAAGDLGIEVLTLYAFSSENWRRPEAEISDLMGLMRRFIISDIGKLVEAGVRLRVIGNYRALDPEIVTLIDDAIAQTAQNNGTTLCVALNYGAQDELVRAARAAAGHLPPEKIDLAAIEAELDTQGLPPLDLLIRTSGERRLSNFLLWQAAYAEILFIDTLWPDFDKATLAKAVDDFTRRERRFGGL